MTSRTQKLTRRAFLAGTAAIGGLSLLPSIPARASAKYVRYNVTSTEGRKMLDSYAKAIKVMLELPPDNPHNWFRNAFIHFMDCPHGNWWFFDWHRGYIGLFEQIIRKYSENPEFTLPFWDWTELPRIPEDMFNGVLTPVDDAYLPYTKDLMTFERTIKPSLEKYWASLNADQRAQMDMRGYKTFDQLWNDVCHTQNIGDQAFAETKRARYLSRDNPGFNEAVTLDSSREVVLSGLGVTFFYPSQFDAAASQKKYEQALSFNSIATKSHVDPPNKDTWFSILEGLPHNNIHNFIGGVGGPWDPGPYGNMTNNLSPVDPVFFLHHANMDRLWDVWTRKQMALRLPFGPDEKDRDRFMNDPFRFFVNSDGTYLTNAKAGDYFDTAVFDYTYAPGTGEELIPNPSAAPAVAMTTLQKTSKRSVIRSSLKQATGQLTLPAAAKTAQSYVIAITLAIGENSARTYDVLVNAPENLGKGGDRIRYLAGQISLFGHRHGHQHGHQHEATFLIPLVNPDHIAAFRKNGHEALKLSVEPATANKTAPTVKSIAVYAL